MATILFSWKGGQDGLIVSLWSVRNFRGFADKGLYLLLEIVHLMRALCGVRTRGERGGYVWLLGEVADMVGLCSRVESLLKWRLCICSGTSEQGLHRPGNSLCLGHFQSMAAAPSGVSS